MRYHRRRLWLTAVAARSVNLKNPIEAKIAAAVYFIIGLIELAIVLALLIGVGDYVLWVTGLVPATGG